MTRENHECNKRFCVNCSQNREVGNLCYMSPLKNVLPADDKVLYVFHNFETTQNARYSDRDTLHVPNLVWMRQFCSRCEDMEDIARDCIQCGKRSHSFWEDPFGDVLSYLCEPRPWFNKIVAVTHNAKAFDLHFILNRAIVMK